jgi:hypothetical protein
MSVMFTTCLRGSREPGLPDGYGALVEKSMGDYDSDGWKRDRWGPLMSDLGPISDWLSGVRSDTRIRKGSGEIGLRFREAMRNFATGVCVVTTFIDGTDGRHDALTINSLRSVSINPPLISLCLPIDSDFLGGMLKAKVWRLMQNPLKT